MGPLELRQESSGLRYYLDGRPVHAGTFLELRLYPDAVVNDHHVAVGPSWLIGRYEWNCRPGTRPIFFFTVADGLTGISATLPDGAICRWPAEE